MAYVLAGLQAVGREDTPVFQGLHGGGSHHRGHDSSEQPIWVIPILNEELPATATACQELTVRTLLSVLPRLTY